ncbi:DUF4145 domain-containing protein [Xanthomonas arboricola]|uniref:DUF4145 domain-containing protein n=1 Tax=Xanthomonas arboricola TaxID=56448 RepID=UPI00161486DE|nr:DUF4145 domain-containing protein [Xanthomonas arboricola]MBB4727928.1 hypothetical protein [Xanthomonas arboricola]
MNELTEVIRSPCRSCGRHTKNAVLHQVTQETDPSEYHERTDWQIVQCLGCDTISLRYVNTDYEVFVDGFDEDAGPEQQTFVYPVSIADHQSIKRTGDMPDIIRRIYRETLSAIGFEALLLGSIGLRACVEAVCNHLEISGSNLQRRIDQLQRQGHISDSDRKRLHVIRFMGNDAAHEITEPKYGELIVALEIVEHLLNSLFVLSKKAKDLDTTIENYDEFVAMVRKCARQYSQPAIVTLAGLIGRRRRLLSRDVSDFEPQLVADIREGKLPFLEISETVEAAEKLSGGQLYQVTKPASGFQAYLMKKKAMAEAAAKSSPMTTQDFQLADGNN